MPLTQVRHEQGDFDDFWLGCRVKRNALNTTIPKTNVVQTYPLEPYPGS
jgi:hypothetical protein